MSIPKIKSFIKIISGTPLKDEEINFLVSMETISSYMDKFTKKHKWLNRPTFSPAVAFWTEIMPCSSCDDCKVLKEKFGECYTISMLGTGTVVFGNYNKHKLQITMRKYGEEDSKL